jgi:alanine racemase
VVRCGIALYGHDPSGDVHGDDLRPALALKARVSFVKRVDAGARLSYGLRYGLERESVIATVPLGYADGVPRRLSSSGGEVLIGGRRRPLAGTVTMDQVMVDCGPDDPVQAGDEVVLIGRQGDAEVTAEEWADALGTISYEILCGIGPRVPRVYVG